jgi:hypothetical protein
MSTTTVLADVAGTYLHWGVIQISVANLIVIGLMIVFFVLALVLPFPGDRHQSSSEDLS